jgi:hypothetical protein
MRGRETNVGDINRRSDRLCSATWGSATPVLAPSEGSFLDAKRGRTWMRFDKDRLQFLGMIILKIELVDEPGAHSSHCFNFLCEASPR